MPKTGVADGRDDAAGASSTPILSHLLSALRSTWARRGFVVVAVTAAVVWVLLERDAVGAALRQADWRWMLVGLLLSFVTVYLATLSWRAISAGLGAPLRKRDASVVYLVGQVGKYLPGGVWNVVASAELGSDHGIARRRTVVTMLLAALVSAVMAGFLAVLLLPGAQGTRLAAYPWLVVLAPVVLLAALPVVLNHVLVTLLRLTRQEPVAERIGLRAVVEAGLWSVLSWTAVGLQVFVLAIAVGAEPGMQLLRLSVGGYALAWIVGFVLIFLPAGVGAREGVLALAMAPVLGAGGVLVVVLLSRVLVTVADLAAAGLALAVARRSAERG